MRHSSIRVASMDVDRPRERMLESTRPPCFRHTDVCAAYGPACATSKARGHSSAIHIPKTQPPGETHGAAPYPLGTVLFGIANYAISLEGTPGDTYMFMISAVSRWEKGEMAKRTADIIRCFSPSSLRISYAALQRSDVCIRLLPLTCSASLLRRATIRCQSS